MSLHVFFYSVTNTLLLLYELFCFINSIDCFNNRVRVTEILSMPRPTKTAQNQENPMVLTNAHFFFADFISISSIFFTAGSLVIQMSYRAESRSRPNVNCVKSLLPIENHQYALQTPRPSKY
jgi:hypothetical protein